MRRKANSERMLAASLAADGVLPWLRQALGNQPAAGSPLLLPLVVQHVPGLRFLFSDDGTYLEEVNAWQLAVAGRTSSPHTRRARSAALVAILKWFEAADLRWQDCTELAHINLVRQHYRGAPPAMSGRPPGKTPTGPKVRKETWNQWMVHWYQFLRYAERKGWIDGIGFELWQAKQRGTSERLIAALRPEEYRAFAGAARTQRLRAGLATFIGTGMRSSEVTALRDHDVPSQTEFAGVLYRPWMIVGKGQKSREVLWPLSAAKAVHAYRLGERRLAIEALKERLRSGRVPIGQTFLIPTANRHGTGF